MPETPEIQERPAQSYAGVRYAATMDRVGQTIGGGMPELFAWLGRNQLRPNGAPFVRYHVVDMERELEFELGVPVAADVPSDERVQAGTLPAGRWATLLYTGPPNGLVDANARLLAWAKENGHAFEQQGSRWQGRVEHYLTDPNVEPDPTHWRTEVAYLLARTQ